MTKNQRQDEPIITQRQKTHAFYQVLGNTLLASTMNYTLWFAIVFFVYLQTQSVFATGIISGIYLVAVAFSGFWFGSIVAHHGKKNAMLLSSIVSLISYILCFAVYVTAGADAFKDPSSSTLWI